MKFKPTIMYASMLAVGAVVSLPAFAAHQGADSQVSKMEAIMNKSQVNAGTPSADWFKRIRVSGLVNFDARWSDHTLFSGDSAAAGATTTGGGSNSALSSHQSSDFAVNNANLFIDAAVNDWTNVHVSLLYAAANAARQQSYVALPAAPFKDTGITADEAYVSMHDFAQTPIFVKAGVQYLDFGMGGEQFPMVFGLSQLLSQTRATALTAGMVTASGVYTSASVFRGPRNFNDSTTNGKNTTRINNLTAQVGFRTETNGFDFDGAVGYMHDMSSVRYINYRMTGNNVATTSTRRRVGGFNAHAKVGFNAFYGTVDMTKAMSRFNRADLANVRRTRSRGARPFALDTAVGYRFNVAAHESNIELGYGHTTNAAGATSANNTLTTDNLSVGLYLPQDRYMVQGTVKDVLKNTDLGAALVNDQSYRHRDGGMGRNYTTAVVRMSVHFA